MIGKISVINSTKTRAGVFVENYGYSVLQGDELPISIGDEISGALRDIGDSTFFNKSRQISFEATVDDYDQGKTVIRQSILGKK